MIDLGFKTILTTIICIYLLGLPVFGEDEHSMIGKKAAPLSLFKLFHLEFLHFHDLSNRIQQ